jgi:uncharacterized membrane protein YdjX (TVP38/TMEM64 family)
MEDPETVNTGEEGARHGGSASLRTRFGLVRWLPLGLLASGLAVLYLAGLHEYFSLEALRRSEAELSAFVAEHGLSAPLLYAAIYVAAVALSFPGASFLTIAGGFLFGAAKGTALALVSATIGATLIFLAARTSIGSVLRDKAGPRMQRLRDGFKQDSVSYLLFLRLAPIFPFWLVNLAAAIFGMRLAPYMLATAVGILPGTFVFSYFGHGLRSAIGSESPRVPAELFLGLALLALMALVPVVVRRLRRGGKHGEAAP